MPGNQKQQYARKKLRQPHQSKIERAMRDVINLPSYRDRLHLYSSHNQKSCNLEQHKARMRKRDPSSSGVGGRWHGSSNVPQNKLPRMTTAHVGTAALGCPIEQRSITPPAKIK